MTPIYSQMVTTGQAFSQMNTRLSNSICVILDKRDMERLSNMPLDRQNIFFNTKIIPISRKNLIFLFHDNHMNRFLLDQQSQYTYHVV